jgi:hypothetical protein
METKEIDKGAVIIICCLFVCATLVTLSWVTYKTMVTIELIKRPYLKEEGQAVTEMVVPLYKKRK